MCSPASETICLTNDVILGLPRSLSPSIFLSIILQSSSFSLQTENDIYLTFWRNSWCVRAARYSAISDDQRFMYLVGRVNEMKTIWKSARIVNSYLRTWENFKYLLLEKNNVFFYWSCNENYDVVSEWFSQETFQCSFRTLILNTHN